MVHSINRVFLLGDVVIPTSTQLPFSDHNWLKAYCPWKKCCFSTAQVGDVVKIYYNFSILPTTIFNMLLIRKNMFFYAKPCAFDCFHQPYFVYICVVAAQFGNLSPEIAGYQWLCGSYKKLEISPVVCRLFSSSHRKVKTFRRNCSVNLHESSFSDFLHRCFCATPALRIVERRAPPLRRAQTYRCN